jgi:protein-S-isoprenylcysteine O-methyltransferase Ste14
MTHTFYWYVISGCWGLILLIWLVGWGYNLLGGPKTRKRAAYTPIWIIGVAVVYILIRQGIFETLVLAGSSPPWVKVIGVILLIPATAFTAWARVSLGDMWSAAPEAKVGHQLRTQGPYKVTRHPIYTGIIGMLLGSLMISGTGYWVLFTVIGLWVVLVKAPQEEKLMVETFGEQYREYQRRVPRIIPGAGLLRRGS